MKNTRIFLWIILAIALIGGVLWLWNYQHPTTEAEQDVRDDDARTKEYHRLQYEVRVKATALTDFVNDEQKKCAKHGELKGLDPKTGQPLHPMTLQPSQTLDLVCAETPKSSAAPAGPKPGPLAPPVAEKPSSAKP